MGEVWRAYDTVTDRVVALKVLPANFAQDSVFQQRFRREAHAAAQLNEPHVVPFTPTERSTGGCSWICG
jgi:serine/threonine-protein kinase